jgi:hypothetical protein
VWQMVVFCWRGTRQQLLPVWLAWGVFAVPHGPQPTVGQRSALGQEVGGGGRRTPHTQAPWSLGCLGDMQGQGSITSFSAACASVYVSPVGALPFSTWPGGSHMHMRSVLADRAPSWVYPTIYMVGLQADTVDEAP